ncbi:MAG: hypothetical protein WBL53_12290 [Pseudonocardiaceae bacterium]
MPGCPVGELAVCSSCGHRAGNVDQAWRMRADLDVLWLIERAGRVQARRFCIACAPRGRVTDIAYVACGDGPLLVGELAEGRHRGWVWRWLRTRGWRSAARPVCPSCAGCGPDAGPWRDQGQGRLW